MPATEPSDLAAELTAMFETTSGAWWKENGPMVTGYIRDLAEASKETTARLAEGALTPQAAAVIFGMQRDTLFQTKDFAELMTLALAQKLADAALGVVLRYAQAATGIDLAGLVQGFAQQG
jgi:hypothetical protein